MKLNINWNDPIIADADVMKLTANDLDDFYCTASELDKSNLFFVLLTSLHYYEEKKDIEKAAHLSFLTANYLFVALTPPGSYNLALHYMKKAVFLNPKSEYHEWYRLMEQGN